MLLPTVSEFCLAAVDTPGVVGARAGLRLAVLGPIVAAQALKVGACTAANVRVGAVRQEVRALDLPGGFIPATFTLGELQTLCEQMLGDGWISRRSGAAWQIGIWWSPSRAKCAQGRIGRRRCFA